MCAERQKEEKSKIERQNKCLYMCVERQREPKRKMKSTTKLKARRNMWKAKRKRKGKRDTTRSTAQLMTV